MKRSLLALAIAASLACFGFVATSGIPDQPSAVPYSGETLPVYLDQAWYFFRNVGFNSSSDGVTTTTLASTAAEGATTITVQAGLGVKFFANESIVIGNTNSFSFETVTITSVSTDTLTVSPQIHSKTSTGFASGTAVYPTWNDNAHPLDTNAYQALAQFISDATYSERINGFNMLGTVGDMSTNGTDANSKANVPTGWLSVTPASITFAVPVWAAVAQTNARQGNGASFTGTALGAGMTTAGTTLIPVVPGMPLQLTAMIKVTSGTGKLQVTDADSSSVIASTTNIGTASAMDALNMAYPVSISFVVPSPTKSIAIQVLGNTGTSDNVFVDDVRLMRARQSTSDTRNIIECSKNMRVTWLGDSWGTTAIGYLAAALSNRCGFSVNVDDAHIAGNTLQQMNARFATDVLPKNPRYLIINYGANDLVGGVSLAQMQTDIRLAIANARANGMKPIILGLPPIASVMSTSMSENDSMRIEVDKIYQ